MYKKITYIEWSEKIEQQKNKRQTVYSQKIKKDKAPVMLELLKTRIMVCISNRLFAKSVQNIEK